MRSYNISNKIDPFTKNILIQIRKAADALGMDYFLIGATVRDLILHHIYGIQIYRKTNDIDFAVSLKNWGEYELLSCELERQGFRRLKNIMHRFVYDEMTVDFLPFGGIAGESSSIIWPDEIKRKMSIEGFEDAHRNAEGIKIADSPEIIIKIASVQSLAVMKIFAWNERAADQRVRDAKDLYLICTSYIEAGNYERLAAEHTDLLGEDFDFELSGAILLGRDIKIKNGAAVLTSLKAILSGSKADSLALEMASYEYLSSEQEEKIEKCRHLLRNLLLGINNE